jgi:hypothetical protein
MISPGGDAALDLFADFGWSRWGGQFIKRRRAQIPHNEGFVSTILPRHAHHPLRSRFAHRKLGFDPWPERAVRQSFLLSDQRQTDIDHVLNGAPYQALDQRGVGARLDLA